MGLEELAPSGGGAGRSWVGWGWRGAWRCPTKHISFQNLNLTPKPPVWLGKMGSGSVVWGKRWEPSVLVGFCHLHVHAAHRSSSPLRSLWDLFAPSEVSPTSTAGCQGCPQNLGNSTEVLGVFPLFRVTKETP